MIRCSVIGPGRFTNWKATRYPFYRRRDKAWKFKSKKIKFAKFKKARSKFLNTKYICKKPQYDSVRFHHAIKQNHFNKNGKYSLQFPVSQTGRLKGATSLIVKCFRWRVWETRHSGATGWELLSHFSDVWCSSLLQLIRGSNWQRESLCRYQIWLW